MIHVIIKGSVQGVGFRQYIKYKAKKLGVKGWVKNLPDGSVEAILKGSTRDLDKMILICKNGPFLADVKKVEIEDLEDQLFENFDIIKT